MNYIREIESILTNPENFFQLQFELSENAEEIIITHKKHEKLAFITCFFLTFFFW